MSRCTVNDGDTLIAFDNTDIARINPAATPSFKDKFILYITGRLEDEYVEDSKAWSDARAAIMRRALEKAKLKMITIEELEEILVEVMD